MLEYGYYNMDCMQGMKDFPDGYFDLAVVDPPYGIKENGKKNGTRSKLATSKAYTPFAGGDVKPPDEEYFRELFRVSKNQIIFGANHFISKMPYDSPCWIVWDKNNGNNDFADCELAWTSFKTAVRKYKYTWQGMIQENMKNKEYRIHPTQKPVALYEWILTTFAAAGDVVLDTHVGSASSLIACRNTGHKFVGFELSEHYFNLSQERYRQETAQMRLSDFMGGVVVKLRAFVRYIEGGAWKTNTRK